MSTVQDRLATNAAEQARLIAEWKAPDVSKGDIVEFSRDPHSPDWYPAIVNQVDYRQVVLGVFQPYVPAAQPFDGVRHADDPEISVRPGIIESSGIWRHTGLSVNRLGDMEARLKALESKMERVEQFASGGKRKE